MRLVPSQTKKTVADTARRAPSAEVLIERIGRGDKLAMHALFSSHRVRVFRFISRIVRDATLAEDLVSDVFHDVWQQAGRFEARCLASTWLLSIARNKALTALRQRMRQEVDIDHASALADPSDSPEVMLQKKRTSQLLRNCLTALSVKHAEIIDLVYYQGKSIREVAQIIKIPENTVKTRMFSARKHLAEVLAASGIRSLAAA